MRIRFNSSFLVLAAALLLIPAAAHAQAQLVFNSLTLPASASPGEIVTGSISVSNTGNRTGTITSASLSGGGSGSLVGGSVLIGNGATRNVPVDFRVNYSSAAGPRAISASVSGFDNTSFSFISANRANAFSLNVGSPVADLVLLSVTSTVARTSLASRPVLRARVQFATPSNNFQTAFASTAFYLSTDQVFDENNDTFLSSTSRSFSPNGTTTEQVTVDFDPSTVPGNYFIFAKTDSFTGLTEANENNNSGPNAPIALDESVIDFVFESVTPLTASTSANSFLPTTLVVRYDAPDTSFGFKSVSYRLRLSLDGVLQPTDPTLVSDSVFIAPQTSQGFEQFPAPTVPGTLAAGQYFVIGEIDPVSSFNPNGSFREASELNNIVNSPASVAIAANPADLRITSVTLGVATTAAGSVIPFTYTIQYDAPSSGFPSASINNGLLLSRDVTVSADDVQLNTDFTFLAPAASSNESVTVRLPTGTAPGTYFVLVVADTFSNFNESNENNNARASSAITITASPVDLRLISVLPRDATTSVTRTVVLTYSGIYTAPPGDFDSLDFRVQFYFSKDATFDSGDQLYFTDSLFNIQPNTQFGRIPSTPAPVLPDPGPYFIIARVDGDDDIRESNENNNTAEARAAITLTRPPDDHADTAASTLVPRDILAAAVPITATIDYPRDVDFFTLQAIEGRPLVVAGQTTFSGQVTLLDQDGFRVLNGNTFVSANSPFNLGFIPILTSGTYYLRVAHSSNNNIGTYTITATQFAVDISPGNGVTGAAITSLSDPLPLTASVAYEQSPTGPPPNVTVFTEFYLSADNSFDPAVDFRLGTSSSVVTTTNGGLFAGNFDLTSSSFSVPPGLYFVFARVDSTNALQETNESNNFLRSASQIRIIAANTDVNLTSFSVTNNTPSASSLVPGTFTMTLTQPAGRPPVNVFYQIYASRDATFDDNDVSLTSDSILVPNVGSAGEPLRIPLSADLTGTYTLFFRADFFDSIVEVSEANNIRSAGPITIGQPAADISVTGALLTTSASAGEMITLTASVVYTAPTSLFPAISPNVNVAISTDLLGSNRVSLGRPSGFTPGGLLLPNASPLPLVGTSFLPRTGLQTRQYFVGFELTSTPALAETSSGNNRFIAVQRLNVQTVPEDLSIVSFSTDVTQTAALGTFRPAITIRNIGEATGQNIDFFLTSAPFGSASGQNSFTSFFRSLQTGDNVISPTTLVIPGNTPPGDYFLTAVVARFNSLSESNTANNVANVPFRVLAPQVDFSWVDIDLVTRSISAGDSIVLSATARYDTPNTTNFQAASTTVRGYLSLDSTLEKLSDIVIGDGTQTFQPQQTVTRLLTLNLPASVAPGNYFVIGELDPFNSTNESNESNNTRVSTQKFAIGSPQVDLSVLTFAANDNSVVPGQTIAYTATLFYDAPSVGFSRAQGVNVQAFLSADRFFDPGVDVGIGATGISVGPGQTAFFNWNGSVPAAIPAGNYFLLGVVDPSNILPDFNRSNNTAIGATAFQVLPPASDLKVDSITFSPSTVHNGQSLRVVGTFSYAVTSAIPFERSFADVEFYLSEDGTYDRYGRGRNIIFSRTFTIAPGATSTVNFDLSMSNISPGQYFVGAAIDPFATVGDTDRRNNLLFSSSPVTVTAPPPVDLALSPITIGPASITAGQTFSQAIRASNLTTPDGRDPIDFFINYALVDSNTTTPAVRITANNVFNELPFGDSLDLVTSVNVPSSTPGGNYFLEARITPFSPNRDVNQSNNRVVSSNQIAVVGLPAQNPSPPTVRAGPDRTIAAGRAITIFGSVTDPDFDVTSIVWSQVAGTSVLGSVITTKNTLRTPALPLGSYTFRLTARDANNSTVTDDAVITAVDPNTLGPVVDSLVGALEPFTNNAEGGRATQISATIDDVAADGSGNIFYLESSRNRVRRVNPGAVRTVSTVAGAPVTSAFGKDEPDGKTERPPQFTGENTDPGFFGDGQPATVGRFGFPLGISSDSTGNLLIADTLNHRIRQVAGGILSTIAGGGDVDPFGLGGFSGDNGSALTAALKSPEHAVRNTSNGDIYIADTGNNRVRKVSGGNISTIAGNGFPGSTGDGGPGVMATLNQPSRLAMDGGDVLLICERAGNRIRRLQISTGVISTLAGTGQAGFNGDGVLASQAALNRPNGVGRDSAGAYYISDTNNSRIRRVDPSQQTIATQAGNGTFGFSGDAGAAVAAQLAGPKGTAVDASKVVYFVDGSQRVRTVTPASSAAAPAPAVAIFATDNSGSFSVANDQNSGLAGIQTDVAYSGLPTSGSLDTDDHLLELTIVESGTNITTVFTAAPVGGNATFRGITLNSGRSYDFRLRDLTNGNNLSRIAVTEGRTPVANIRVFAASGQGPQLIRLDGTGSTDDDPGDVITYTWSLLRGPASAPVIPDLDAIAPVLRYRAQASGQYVFRLTVVDTSGRTSSAQASVTIVNVPPVAQPGPSRQFLLPNPASVLPANRTTSVIAFDGRASNDANGDPITYSWRIVRRPTRAIGRITPVLVGSTTSVPRMIFSTALTVDGDVIEAGRYLLSLTVTDSLGANTTKFFDVLALDPVNVVPSANAGLDRAVIVTPDQGGIVRDIPDVLSPDPVAFVRLDGRESADSPRPGGQPRPLTYSWRVTSAPASSIITSPPFPNQGTTPLPQFVPDLPGIYTFELTVNNGLFDSNPDLVNIDVSIRGLNAPPTADFRVRDTARNKVSSLTNPTLIFRPGDLVTLDGTFSSDRDDPNQLTYQWTQVAGDRVALAPSSVTSQPTFQPTAPGLYEFDLVVTDPKLSKSLPFRGRLLVVSASDALPALTLTATSQNTIGTGRDFGDEITEGTTSSLSITLPDTVTLRATVVDADVTANTQRLTYAFRQIAGPTVALTTGAINTNALVSEVQFSPTTSRVHVFEGRVIELDSAGSPTGVEMRRFIRVVVNSPANGVPTATANVFPNKVAIGLCQPVRMSGAGSADSGNNATPVVQYRWTQVAGPQVVLSNPFSVQTTFVAPDLGSDEPREVLFALVVDDGNDQSEPSVVSIVLDPTTTQTAELALGRGLDLISLPVQPRTTPAFNAEDLAQLTSSPVVIRAGSGEDGEMQFTVWHAGLGVDPFPINGNEGYLISRRQPGVMKQVIGRPWAGAQLGKRLGRGLNLVSYPRGAPGNETVGTLLGRSGGTYAVRFNTGNGKFEVYIPGLTPTAWPIERGRSYLLSAPSSSVLSLPTCAQ